MRAVVIQKKKKQRTAPSEEHVTQNKKQRTATSEEAVTQSGPRLIASATMLFAVLRTPPLVGSTASAWWAAPPREDALIALIALGARSSTTTQGTPSTSPYVRGVRVMHSRTAAVE